jgi:hypothetical protein
MGFCFRLEEFGVHPAMGMETRSESFKIHIGHEYFPQNIGKDKPWEYDQHMEIEYVDLPGLVRALIHVAETKDIDLDSKRDDWFDPIADCKEKLTALWEQVEQAPNDDLREDAMKEWLKVKQELYKLEEAGVGL